MTARIPRPTRSARQAVRRTLGLVTTAAIVVLVLAPSARGAQAQDDRSLTLSLDEAIQRAVAASHRVEEARARGDAATAVVGERHSSTLPQVNGQAGFQRTNHVDEFGILGPDGQFRIIYPDVPDNYRTRLDVQWPIYTGGRLESIEAAARREQSAAARDVDTTAADVRLEVARAFWSLVVTRESLRVLEESLTRMGEHVRDVRNQFDAGLVPPNDVLSAQAQEARQRMLTIQARATRDVAEADLARLVDVDPGTRITPSATLEPPVVDTNVDALVGEALRRRPERQALEERMAGALARVQAAEAGRRPTVAVGGGFDYARPNPRIFPRAPEWRESWDAGVNVSVPLFDGGRANHEMAEAAAMVRAARARLAEFDSVVALEIRQRLSELESSRAALDAANAGVQAATEARRVVGDRFAAGVATSTDVVDAQVAVLQAELDRTQAIASAHVAEARLDRAVGR